jgi:hypothetical protein
MISVKNLEKQVISRVHVEYGEDIRPVRDWLSILGGIALLFFFSMLWNVWMYVRISNGEVIGSTTTTQPGVDASAITAAESVFQKRATEETNYKTVYHFVDPSK